MGTYNDTVFMAICENDRTNTPWSVVEENGFEAIPSAYLTDISYAGSTQVVVTVNNWREEYGCHGEKTPHELEMALRELIGESQ